MIQLKRILREDLVGKIGWLQAVKTLFTSIIIPTLTYACQTYVYMTKKQENELEGAMKNILYQMLEISKFSHYAAVLMECGMMRIKHIIAQLKIGFLRSLVHEKRQGFCLKLLEKEEELQPGSGLISEVRDLCEKYGLPDVYYYNVNI